MEFWTRVSVDQDCHGKDTGKWPRGRRRRGGVRELSGMGGVGKKRAECIGAIGFELVHYKCQICQKPWTHFGSMGRLLVGQIRHIYHATCVGPRCQEGLHD